MIEPDKTAVSSNPPSRTDGIKVRIMDNTQELQELAAYKIQKQLKDILRISTDNKMDMLSYLIEMALLEATGKAKKAAGVRLSVK